MSSDIPEPRDARRQEWPWGIDVVGVCDDGASWTADGTITAMDWTGPKATVAPQQGRSRWLQLDGNRMVIMTETDAENPNGLWYSPISLLREHIVSAVARERVAIASGTSYPMKSVVVVNVGGRKLARRAWSWRMRDGGAVETDWIDPDYLEWEIYVAALWPKVPAPRVPMAMEQQAA